MTVIAEIQVAPSPPGTAENPHAHVEAAIAVIQASGLRYEVGALGTTLTQALQDRECDVPVRAVGLPQKFFDHGSRGQVLADAGLTEQDIARRIAEWTAVLTERAEGVVDDAEETTAVEGRP